MRHAAAAASCVALVALLAAASASAGIGVRASAGLGYVSYGDFNDFVAHLDDVVLAANGASGTISSMHWVGEFGGEITAPLVPMLDLGIGFGIIRGSSDFTFSAGGDRFDYKHTVTAYPVTATAYAKLPLVPFAKPYAFAGVGVYYANASFDEEGTSGGSSSGFSAELTKWGFGLHGGAGLSFALVPRASLDLGVKGRWAKIRGLRGTATATDGAKTDVFLAYYKDADGAPQFGPESTADAAKYGEGSVDLSGVAFTLTLRVVF